MLSQHLLAIVTKTIPSKDGLIRSAELTYHHPGPGQVELSNDGVYQWKGEKRGKLKGKAVIVSRSVQRLCLILGVEEQSGPLYVVEDVNCVTVNQEDEEF